MREAEKVGRRADERTLRCQSVRVERRSQPYSEEFHGCCESLGASGALARSRATAQVKLGGPPVRAACACRTLACLVKTRALALARSAAATSAFCEDSASGAGRD